MTKGNTVSAGVPGQRSRTLARLENPLTTRDMCAFHELRMVLVFRHLVRRTRWVPTWAANPQERHTWVHHQYMGRYHSERSRLQYGCRDLRFSPTRHGPIGITSSQVLWTHLQTSPNLVEEDTSLNKVERLEQWQPPVARHPLSSPNLEEDTSLNRVERYVSNGALAVHTVQF